MIVLLTWLEAIGTKPETPHPALEYLAILTGRMGIALNAAKPSELFTLNQIRTLLSIWLTPLNPKDLITLEELTIANMWEWIK